MFALCALLALGTPRTGVMVAIDTTGVPLTVPALLTAVLIGAACGFLLVVAVGDRYLRTVGNLNYTAVSGVVFALLLGLSFAFTGPVGVGVFLVATLVGLVPPRFGARRVHLMGVLIGPLLL